VQALAPYLQTRLFGDGAPLVRADAAQTAPGGDVAARLAAWWRAHRSYGRVAAGVLNVAFQLRYLLDASPFFSPALRLTGAILERDDGRHAVRAPP